MHVFTTQFEWFPLKLVSAHNLIDNVEIDNNWTFVCGLGAFCIDWLVFELHIIERLYYIKVSSCDSTLNILLQIVSYVSIIVRYTPEGMQGCFIFDYVKVIFHSTIRTGINLVQGKNIVQLWECEVSRKESHRLISRFSFLLRNFNYLSNTNKHSRYDKINKVFEKWNVSHYESLKLCTLYIIF